MSYISDYVTFTANTESPPLYHKWACLASLSVLAGRRFWFNLGPIRYYTNLYILLVGDPGVKKSSALDRAKGIIRAVTFDKNCKIPVAAAQATKEFIGKAMSNEKFPGRRYFTTGDIQQEYNQYAIFATEFTQFISVNPFGMLDFLTTVYTEDLYNCDTKGQGSDLVVGPYITLLGCLTPEMLKGFLKQNILTGGFARRTVFVWGNKGQIIPIPSYTDEQKAAKEQCIKYGEALQSLSGEFIFGPGAEKWYTDWYMELHTHMTEIAVPSTRGWFETKHEILFKCAMLVALSEFKIGAPMYLLPEHFDIVEKQFLLPIEKNLPRVFEGAGQNPNAQAAAQVCHMLEALGHPMGRKTLEGMFYDQVTDLNALRDMIDHLIAVGRLEKLTLSKSGQILGDVIAAPGIISRYSGDELAKFLVIRLSPGTVTYKDSSPAPDPK